MLDTDLDTAPNSPPSREIFTIGRLNREARVLLERGLGTLWLEGEISNLSRPSSGHWYFSLKDEAAQVRCAMFRQRNLQVRFPVKDGAHVLARGRVSLYEARGEFQVVIDHLEEAGEGLLLFNEYLGNGGQSSSHCSSFFELRGGLKPWQRHGLWASRGRIGNRDVERASGLLKCFQKR